MRKIVVLCGALALGGCASLETTSLTPEALATFEASQDAILIVSLSGDLQCERAFIGLNRRGEETNRVVTTVRDPGYESSNPAVLVVPPGHYALNRGSCMRDGYYPSDLPNLNLWFGGIEIKAGEVVYMGTLDAQRFTYETRLPDRNAVAQFLFSSVDEMESNYLTYTMVNNSDVPERISAQYPDLGRQVVFRAPPPVMSNEEFTAMLDRSFAPDESGVMPTKEEARMRLTAEIEALLKAMNAEAR